MGEIKAYKYFQPKMIKAYIEEQWENKIPYLGETLFPTKKKAGLNLKMIKGAKGAPAALMPSSFDTDVTFRERIGFELLETEMPYFKEAYSLNETQRQELLKLQEAAENNTDLTSMIGLMYDDAGELLDAAEVTAEWMRMQAVSTGKIAIVANETNLEYDYRVPAANFKTITGTTDKWDHANATIIDDIDGWKEQIREATGVEPTIAICNSSVFKSMFKNTQIKNQFNNFSGQGTHLTRKMIRQFFLDNLGIALVVYDKVFKAPEYDSSTGKLKKTLKTMKFFPDDKFVLLPEGFLGNTWYGTTPEEADLNARVADADVALVDNKIAVTQYTQKDPVKVITKVSQVCLPSFEAGDQVIIATVQ